MRWRKPAKEQSDKPLVDSVGFLFSHALVTLRFDIESGYKIASYDAGSVRKRLLTAIKTGASDPFTLLFLVQSLVLPNSILAKSCVMLLSICSKRLAKRTLVISMPLTLPIFLASSPT